MLIKLNIITWLYTMNDLFAYARVTLHEEKYLITFYVVDDQLGNTTEEELALTKVKTLTEAKTKIAIHYSLREDLMNWKIV